MIKKRSVSVFFALLLSMLMTVSVFAGGNEDIEGDPWCEAIFSGDLVGEVCEVKVSLNVYTSADPMDEYFAHYAGGFRLVMSDAAGKVLKEEWFPGGEGGYTMSYTLTEPGDYYFQVWSGTGYPQGYSTIFDNGEYGYDTTPHHVKVLSGQEAFVDTAILDDMALTFVGVCAQVDNEPEPAVIAYLEMVQWNGWASEALFQEFSAFMDAVIMDEQRPAYELLLNNEGYRTMAVTPLVAYDTSIFYMDVFWEKEMWRELAKSGQLPDLSLEEPVPPDAPADGVVPDVAPDIGDGTGSDSIITDGALPGEGAAAEDTSTAGEGSPVTWIAIGGGAVALAVVVLVLLKKKKK